MNDSGKTGDLAICNATGCQASVTGLGHVHGARRPGMRTFARAALTSMCGLGSRIFITELNRRTAMSTSWQLSRFHPEAAVRQV